MHPVIRIVTCICLISVLVRAPSVLLIIISAALVVIALLHRPGCLLSALAITMRLKWLFVSIAILYLWMTPGDPLITTQTGIDNLLPGAEGLSLAIQRISVLLLIIISVQLLITGISKDKLYTSVSWLLSPLQKIGIPAETFSLRCALCVEELHKLDTTIKSMLKTLPEGTRINRAVLLLAMTYAHALHDHDNNNNQTIRVEYIKKPEWYQWLIPLLVIIVPYMLTWQGIIA